MSIKFIIRLYVNFSKMLENADNIVLLLQKFPLSPSYESEWPLQF